MPNSILIEPNVDFVVPNLKGNVVAIMPRLRKTLLVTIQRKNDTVTMADKSNEAFRKKLDVGSVWQKTTAIISQQVDTD